MARAEAVDVVSDMLHMASDNADSKAFLESMTRQHRTHQQAFTSLCLRWIKVCSTQQSDLRNEAAVEACKNIVEKCDIQPLPFL